MSDDLIKAAFGGNRTPAQPQAAPPGAADIPANTKPLLTLGVRTRSRQPVAIPREFETRHIMLSGTTGSGKSQAIFNLLKTIRERGEPAIIMDHGGETLQRFYRPGKDFIFNPFDLRGVKMNVFSEARRVYDFAKIARFIIKDAEGDSAAWNERAQVFLANAMRQLSKRGPACRTNEALLYMLTRAATHGEGATLEALMQGTSSQPLFADGAERTLASIQGIVADGLPSLEHLLLRDRDSNARPFCMADWLREPGDSWVYLSYTDASFAALQPLFRIIIASAIQNVMELTPDADRRLYFVLDELASLGNVPHLTDALTKFRKYGACVISGFQAFSQLEKIYGKEGAQTLMSCFNTQVLLRTGDSATAEAESLLIGDEMRQETNTSTNEGTDNTSHGTSTSWQVRRSIMPQEFMGLPDLRGFARVGGQKGIFSIEIPYAGLTPITVAEETDPAIFDI